MLFWHVVWGKYLSHSERIHWPFFIVLTLSSLRCSCKVTGAAGLPVNGVWRSDWSCICHSVELTKFCDPEICDACNNYIQQLRQSHASHFYHLIFGHFSVDCRPRVAGKIDLFLIVVYSILFYLVFGLRDFMLRVFFIMKVLIIYLTKTAFYVVSYSEYAEVRKQITDSKCAMSYAQ